MTPKDPQSKEDVANKAEPDPEPRKHRRHGYRGYPNNPDIGGDIHIGTGFGGVGPGGSELPARSSLLSEKTRESVEELGEEEEEEEK